MKKEARQPRKKMYGRLELRGRRGRWRKAVSVKCEEESEREDLTKLFEGVRLLR